MTAVSVVKTETSSQEQPQSNNTENTPHHRNPEKAGEPTSKPDNKEKEVPPNPHPAGNGINSSPPAGSKANRKGRPKMSKKLYPKEQNASITKKKSSSSQHEETRTSNTTTRRKNKGNKTKRRARNRPRQIPLVPSSQQQRVGIARGPVKYQLKRAESNSEHRQRVQSNRRKCRRRARAPKQEDFDYGGTYWTKPEVKLDDLSSLECGSYGDKVEDVEEKESLQEEESTDMKEDEGKVEEKKVSKKSEEVEWGSSFDLEDLDALALKTPKDFVFNPGAPAFEPQEIIPEKRKSIVFTLSELVNSVKGQQLPKMPSLTTSH